MARRPAPTNRLLSEGLAERNIPLEAQAIVELRSGKPVGAFARLGGLGPFSGSEISQFATREGRARELLIYLVERAARHLRTWRARGFRGALHLSVPPLELADRTLATSFDIIAKSQNLEQSAFTFMVPLTDYVERIDEVSSALMRIRRVGCGIAMAVDGRDTVRFQLLSKHPFSAFVLTGNDVWRRLRTAGPGTLGALGSWIGWAESQGLARVATGLSGPNEVETARAYGFLLGEGTHFSSFVAAREFLGPSVSLSESGSAQMRTAGGLPPKPAVAIRRV
jgi:EAL domain-containing protein (putative c-di-GMP-specific phosphodiesterase class I)